MWYCHHLQQQSWSFEYFLFVYLFVCLFVYLFFISGFWWLRGIILLSSNQWGRENITAYCRIYRYHTEKGKEMKKIKSSRLPVRNLDWWVRNPHQAKHCGLSLFSLLLEKRWRWIWPRFWWGVNHGWGFSDTIQVRVQTDRQIDR